MHPAHLGAEILRPDPTTSTRWVTCSVRTSVKVLAPAAWACRGSAWAAVARALAWGSARSALAWGRAAAVTVALANPGGGSVGRTSLEACDRRVRGKLGYPDISRRT